MSPDKCTRRQPVGFAGDNFAVYPHRQHLSAKVRAYMDFFVEATRGLPEFATE